MRYGFTTGSCAAAAAKAAAYMLLSGRIKRQITIETPKGILYSAEITHIQRSETKVSCAVLKDGGDDPDITSGSYIYASVSYIEDQRKRVVIDGGFGVGRVTRPGLDQPVGSAAINRVPREMINKEVLEICDRLDYRGSLQVVISVPDGVDLAKKTFNPRLGIQNGISILGTTGIVEPMSTQALKDTIEVELRMRRAQGYDYVAITPGNYGLEFMKQAYGYDLDRSVKCSNFIGDTIDMAVKLGFRKVLLTGHIGKLIKVAGGIMNTHSKEADCRMELLCAFAIREDVNAKLLHKVLQCVNTEEAIAILEETGKVPAMMQRVVDHICMYLQRRSAGELHVDCIVYANQFGELGVSKEARKWFTLLEREQEQQI